MSQTADKKYVLDESTTEDYAFCVQVASQVFDLIARYMTPPRPKTYELWYHYASRENQSLVEDVDQVLAKSGTLSEYDVEQILNEYNENEKRVVQAQDAIGRHFDQELANIIDMMQTSADRSTEYSAELRETNEALPAISDPQKIREVVQALIARNKEMQIQADTLSENLARSRAHIQALRDDLADLRARSLKDPLTQLGNRGFFDATLIKETSAARLGNEPMCLVIADIDHFKRVNDTYGHLIGDWILKDFASLISSQIKGRDSAARYGGEEFAIVLPQTDLKGAMTVTEMIRRQFEAKERVMKQNGSPMEPVTASFGIAQFQPAEDPSELIARADANLYKAKRSGRNRVVAE